MILSGFSIVTSPDC